MSRNVRKIALLLVLVTMILGASWVTVFGPMDSPEPQRDCAATEHDEMGPFYRPGAPLRSKIGSGYLLHGQVLSTENCAPVNGAQVEVWQAGPDGHYADAYRARMITDAKGRYQLETDAPPPYVGRPPHIHIRVAAEGLETLVTQHYLQPGEQGAEFNLVLPPRVQ